ncbi:MAG: TetR/AcrR family transcriptional regulator [Chloroflexota bacterium]
MARPKEFDQEKALDKAMALFWQKGYEATSIQDLVNHLGIGRRSLYDTFKSKQALYMAALDRYSEMVKSSLAIPDAQPGSPKMAIRQSFEQIIDQVLNDPSRRGCFMVNSAIELAPHDRLVAECVRDLTQFLEQAFYELLERAKKSGELNPALDLQETAQFLNNAVFGIRVQAKINPDRQTLTNVMNLTLSILD